MGKGIALVFKLRYPKMYDLYKERCKSNLIGIGRPWLYKGEANSPWVLNFPTKFHWKYPSKIEYIEKGLEKFCSIYQEQGVTSIAFPILGTHNGGLDKDIVLNLMSEYLGRCEIDTEIYEYVPESVDDLFEQFVYNWSRLSLEEIKIKTGIRKDEIEKVAEAIKSGRVKSMIGLITERGIGIRTMERCFHFVINNKNDQPSLFD
jgi:O-acetyl-ADP-ribose deacetylase (regulator of RNase III)